VRFSGVLLAIFISINDSYSSCDYWKQSYYLYYTCLTALAGQPGYRKDKTSLDFNEARDGRVLGCSGISWTICKQFAPHCIWLTTTRHHHSIFNRPDALSDVQPTCVKALKEA